MKKTQLFTIELQTFQDIEAGKLSYVVQRLVVPVEEGQKVILQAIGTEAEIETVLSHVCQHPKMTKGYYILSFPNAQTGEVIDATAVVFSDPAAQVLDNK